MPPGIFTAWRLCLLMQKQRRCRKAFYLRNGMKEASFGVNLFEVAMEVLTNRPGLSFGEYQAPYQNAFGKDCVKKLRKSNHNYKNIAEDKKIACKLQKIRLSRGKF